MKGQQTTALRVIDTPHYGYWQTLYLSFFYDRLYIDVGKRWKGFSILYLLLLTFIATLPLAARLSIDFNDFYTQKIMLPLQKLPPFFVQNGQVSIDKPMPYFIRNNLNQVIAIIDTTGQITAIDKQYPNLAILVTKDKLIYRPPNPPELFKTRIPYKTPIRVHVFDKKINQVFDTNAWITAMGINHIEFIADIIIYPTIALLFFVIYLVLLITFSLMAQFVSKFLLKFTLTYGQAFRLLMVSATPQIMFLAIVMALQLVFIGMGFILIGLLAAYFSFAVISLKRESNKLVLQ